MEILIDIRRLSEYLGVKVGTIYSWVHSKQIPHKKLGGLLRFSISEIEEWVKQKSVAPFNKYCYTKRG